MLDDKIEIAQLINELNRRAGRAVIGQLGFRSIAATNHLRTILGKRPGQEGSFFASPVFEATFGWQASCDAMSTLEGGLFSGEVLNALNSPPQTPEDLTEHRFPLTRKPYVHQIEAWKALLGDEIKSVLVTSGTGSGKTECFLLPIIEDLHREYKQDKQQIVGVRALFLYPLNALINSQRERLKAWTSGFDGGLRFCLYNGETPTKRTKSSEQRQSPEEVKDRTTLREVPPPILVTNSTMLEYMLVRNDDAPIIEQSKGTLRWIVLDEAHSYVGSQAAELALLLRRVMVSFGVESKNVRFVATSATIGGGDQQSINELQVFLADVAGVDVSQVVVVTGRRDIPYIEPLQPDLDINLAKLSSVASNERFDFLRAFMPAVKIRERLSLLPHAATTDELIHELQPTWPDVNAQNIWELLGYMADSKSELNSFLPFRAHLFQKTLDGIYVCTNPNCSTKSEDLIDTDWKFGQIYLSERDYCSCQAPVQPLVSCNSCGQEYLDADEHINSGGIYSITHPERNDTGDEFIWDLEQDDEVTETIHHLDSERIILTHANHAGLTPCNIQNSTRDLADEVGEITLFSAPASEFECVTCRAKDRADWKVFIPKRLGAPFFLGDSLPTLLEYSPRQGDGPFESRRLLTFTDSRQGTARIAARLQQDIDRNKVRAVIYHGVHVSPKAPSDGEIKKIIEEINGLEDVLKNNDTPALVALLVEKQKELLDLNGPKSTVLTWKEAESTLRNSVDISRYMFDSFKEVSYQTVSLDEYGHFCLLREFMRRPIRGFQLETLGLVEMFYPNIEALAVVPSSWSQWYKQLKESESKALSDWKDWLTILVDMHLRANSAVDFNPSWGKLMGAVVQRKMAVGPGTDEHKNELKWPSAKRSTRSRIVNLLFRGFGLNRNDREDIDHIDQVLEDSWRTLKKTVLSPQDNNRFLLNIRDCTAFRSVPLAYKCPYSHRLVTRVFRNQSPNTPGREEIVLSVEEIKLPSMPFAHQTDRSGREKIINWLESDPDLVHARNMAVWPNRADRIASGEPWFRIAEHSAQLSSTQLKRYEKLFKEGKLNILSCSTTMEMGVDIGGMSIVAMNNVPPHPANYMQRAGRAGRRNEPVSVSYTLCKSSAHSMQVFADPLWPFHPGKIAAPRVSLESGHIVQRHINAYLLTHWLRSFDGNTLKLTTGWFMNNDEEDNKRVDEFISWCNSIKSQEEYDVLSNGVQSVTRGTRLSTVPLTELAVETAEAADRVFQKWWSEFSVLLVDLGVLTENNRRAEQEPAVKAINISIFRMEREYLLSDLARGGFLPGYGFPTNVVSLNPITINQLVRSQKQANSRIDNRLNNRNQPSRDLAVALREYAPGAEIVIQGLVYRSAGITLNWHIPANVEAAPEIQNIFFHWECKYCGEFGDSQQRITQCPYCANSRASFTWVEVLEPAGFAVDLYVDPHTNVNRPTFLPYEEARVAAVEATWLSLPNSKLGSLRYSNNGIVSYISNGMHGFGYTLCLSCGRAEPQRGYDEPVKTVSESHKKLRGGKGSDGSAECNGPDNAYSIKSNLRLASKIQTSVFELQLRDPRDNFIPLKDPIVAWTVGYALRNALCTYLGIVEREVDISLRDIRFENNKAGFTLCLFDTASQGAGFVERAQEELIPLMQIARRNLHCPVECDSVCQHCLLDSSSQYREDSLNRHVAIEWIDAWLQSVDLPEELKFFGEQSMAALSTLEYQLVLASRTLPLDHVQLFVEASAEDSGVLSTWPMLAATQSLIKSGITVEWVIADSDLAELLNTFGNQFSGVKSVFGDALSISRLESPNQIGSSGKIVLCARTGSEMRCWASLGPNLGINEGWGTSPSPIITTKSLMGLIDFKTIPLNLDDLSEKQEKTSVSLRLVDELDGNIQNFGNNFIGFLNENYPEIQQKIADPTIRVEKIIYSDRYIRSPLHLLLLSQILQAVSGKDLSQNTTVEIRTAQYSAQLRPPFRIFHNFQEQEDCTQVLYNLLANDFEDVSVYIEDKRNMSHARTLFIRFSDASAYEIDFDQGMGAWNLKGQTNWERSFSFVEQAKILLAYKGRSKISGPWGTVINIRKSNEEAWPDGGALVQ